MTRFVIAALIIFTVASIISLADAHQMPCGMRADVIDQLQGKYGESRRISGMNPRGVVELYAQDANGAWTIVLNFPNGATCVLAAGNGYTVYTPPAEGDPA